MYKKIFWVCLLMVLSSLAAAYAEPEDMVEEESEYLKKTIPLKELRKIKLPKGYHEGLFYDGNNMWVNNGEKGNTWVIDIELGEVISEIEPVSTFAEGLTVDKNGKRWMTDWDEKKIYRISTENAKMTPEVEYDLGPGHPAGVVSTGDRLYVIIWLRGMGTKYFIREMDLEGKMLKETQLDGIFEPSQIAWNGKTLWVSSWYSRRIYEIDPVTFAVQRVYRSPVKDTTGLVWCGETLWVTGTHSDLYQVEI